MRRKPSFGVVLSAALLSILSFSHCSTEELTEKNLQLKAIEVAASGPLFEGSNTAQGSCRPGLEGLLQDMGMEPGQLRSARLKSATVHLPDTGLTVPLETLSLLFAAEELDMQTMGVLNPVPAGQNPLQIKVAAEQENTAEWLKQPEFTVVLDCGLGGDLDEDLKLKIDLEFTLFIKE